MRYLMLFCTILVLSISMGLATPKPDVLTRYFVYPPGSDLETNVEFDPSAHAGLNVWRVILEDMFEPLVYVTSEGGYRPGGANSWDYSEDGMVIFIELNPDRVWSDGTAITAEDFVFTLERMRNPEFATAVMSFLSSSIVGFDQGSEHPFGVVAETPTRLRIEMTKPYAIDEIALSTMAFVPLPRHKAPEKYAHWSTWPGGVTNGSYTLENVNGHTMILKRNPHRPKYVDPSFEWVEIKLEFWPVAAQNFLDGNVDFLSGIPERQMQWFLENGVKTFGSNARVFYLAMNTKNEKLKDRRVRRALRLAVDRASLVQRLYPGRAVPAYSIIPEGVLGYKPHMSLPDLDHVTTLAEAKSLMKDAGFSADRRLKLTFSSNYKVEYKALVEFLRLNWAEIYVDLDYDLDEMDFQKWFKRFTDGDFELGRRSWNSSTPSMDYFMDVCRALDDARCGYYNDPEYKRILESAYLEEDLDRRRALFQEADRMIVDADVIIPVFHGIVPAAIGDRIDASQFEGTVRRFRAHDLHLR